MRKVWSVAQGELKLKNLSINDKAYCSIINTVEGLFNSFKISEEQSFALFSCFEKAEVVELVDTFDLKSNEQNYNVRCHRKCEVQIRKNLNSLQYDFILKNNFLFLEYL